LTGCWKQIGKRLSVANGIDEELDEERRTYEGLGDFLEQVAKQEINCLPAREDLRISVVFFPQLGYLVVSPNDGSPALPCLELHFSTDEWLYWKSDRMRELGMQAFSWLSPWGLLLWQWVEEVDVVSLTL
jgi:hypothetical protein